MALRRHIAVVRPKQFIKIANKSFWGQGGGKEPQYDFDVDKDYYKIMGLTKDATESDIKNAYYKLCYQYHPDRSGGMHQDKFKEVNNAYEVLKDKKKKQAYDEAKGYIKSE